MYSKFYSPYHINKIVINTGSSSTIYFECGKSSCKARIILKFFDILDDRIVIEKKKDHTCNTNIEELNKIDFLPVSVVKRIINSKRLLAGIDFSDSGKPLFKF